MNIRARTINLRPWAFPGHPRVLLEHSEPDAALELAAALREEGCTVGICRGPAAERGTRCPLHGLEPCIAVEGADLVVNALDLSKQDAREVVRSLRARYPSTPLVVLAEGEDPELTLPPDCTVLDVGTPAAGVVKAVLDRLSSPAAS